MVKPAILTNLVECNGCWTCATSCTVWNKLPDDMSQWWSQVRTEPSGRMDEPAGTWPNPKMSFVPVAFPKCTMCADRAARGLQPFCVYNCPIRCKTYGDLDDPTSAVSVAMKGFRDKGYRIYQLPDVGTTTHAAWYYADKP